jgi:predicted membrane protein
VREAVHILDLDVLFYPCPKGGATYRPRVTISMMMMMMIIIITVITIITIITIRIVIIYDVFMQYSA